MYFLDTAYFAAHKTDFYAMRMRGRFCENITDDAICEIACVLILFQDDGDTHTLFEICSFSPRH